LAEFYSGDPRENNQHMSGSAGPLRGFNEHEERGPCSKEQLRDEAEEYLVALRLQLRDRERCR
jgi:hypothetical protein